MNGGLLKKPTKKLAIVIPSLKGGGIARAMINVGAALRSGGWFETVDLVPLANRGPADYDIYGDVRIIEPNASRLLRSVAPFARYLSHSRPTCILSAGETANLISVGVSRLMRVDARVVVCAQTHLSVDTANTPLQERPLRLRTVPALVRRMYPAADAVIAVSAGVARDLVENHAVPREQISIIHNPVGTDVADLGSAQIEHPWLQTPVGQPVILSAGRLVAQKDFAMLVRAFALLREDIDVRLVILGKGPLRAELLELAESLGVRQHVDLPGFVRNPYAWITRADVFAMSSAWEGSPNVLVEALACGTPVVSTDCPSGPAEILDGGKIGPLVPVGDSVAMARALARVLRAPPEKATLRARAHDFSLEATANAYGKVLCGQ